MSKSPVKCNQHCTVSYLQTPQYPCTYRLLVTYRHHNTRVHIVCWLLTDTTIPVYILSVGSYRHHNTRVHIVCWLLTDTTIPVYILSVGYLQTPQYPCTYCLLVTYRHHNTRVHIVYWFLQTPQYPCTHCLLVTYRHHNTRVHIVCWLLTDTTIPVYILSVGYLQTPQ